MRRLAFLLLAASIAPGCAQGEMPCRVGADCESGVCLVDGTCMPAPDASAAADAGAEDAGPMADGGPGPVDAEAGDDAGAPSDSGAPTDGGPADCGDGDGVLTRAELPLPLGVAIGRRVAFDVAVDTQGAVRGDGSRLWDFEGPFAGDADRNDQRRPLTGAWFEESFPGATYTLELSAEDDLLGVFELTDDALLLRGVVSPEGGTFRTELEYDPPVGVWRLPLEEGDAWDETSTVSGVLDGVVTAYTERWDVEVDAAGDLGTPAGVRSVLRVNTSLTRTVGLVVTTTTRHAYVEECVGTVAQVYAAAGDGTAEPTYAAELWRVAP